MFKSFIASLFSIFISVHVMAYTPDFTLNAEDIKKNCADSIAALEQAVSKITSSKDAPTFENTVLALEDATTTFDENLGASLLMLDASPDEATRNESESCTNEYYKSYTKLFVNKSLFQKFDAIKQSNSLASKNSVDQKLFNDYYRAFLSNGVNIDDPAKVKKIEEIQNKISELETSFSKKVNEDQPTVEFTKAEMDGVTEDMIPALKKTDSGNYIIGTTYSQYFPFMENAKNENSRKKLYYAFNTRGGQENVQRLEDALKLRQELANIMGYASHAEKKLKFENRMATSVADVRGFLNSLSTKLQPYLAKDLEDIKNLKCKDTQGCQDANQMKVNPWDTTYYVNQMKKKLSDFDPSIINQYFPLQVVISGMFDIYQNLLGVNFRKVESNNVWHPDVQVFSVTDKVTNEQYGYFYLDMYPREGKYQHAGVNGLIKAKLLGNGKHQDAIAVMLCNFGKPTAEKPSLLSHDEVETFFHEFGHVMADDLSRTKYASHNASFPRDFVEAPSQMLENWVWTPETLAMLSGHYQTGEKIPSELLSKMIALKNVANGLLTTRQVFLATIDLDYHSMPQPLDTSKEWQIKSNKINGVEMVAGVYPQAAFGHLMGGYDVGYYGYLWSKVYAEDMFSVFEENGILNEEIGLRYRNEILRPSGSRPTSESLKAFLGREPNDEAFLKSLGIQN